MSQEGNYLQHADPSMENPTAAATAYPRMYPEVNGLASYKFRKLDEDWRNENEVEDDGSCERGPSEQSRERNSPS